MSHSVSTAFADDTHPREDDTIKACPESVAFCDGTCPEWDGEHHTSGFQWAEAQNGAGKAIGLSVSVTGDGVDAPKVHLLETGAHGDVVLTPTQSRKLALLLLTAADLAVPLTLEAIG